MIRLRAAAALLLTLSACSSASPEISRQIDDEYDASRGTRIDLSRVGPPTWDRVCVLGPYADNRRAEATLGFAWNVWLNSSIAWSDGINVLVFIRGADVVAYAEHPRNGRGDFAKLASTCLARGNAVVVPQATPDGWTYLVAGK